MTRLVTTRAERCPDTQFVIGGHLSYHESGAVAAAARFAADRIDR